MYTFLTLSLSTCTCYLRIPSFIVTFPSYYFISVFSALFTCLVSLLNSHICKKSISVASILSDLLTVQIHFYQPQIEKVCRRPFIVLHHIFRLMVFPFSPISVIPLLFNTLIWASIFSFLLNILPKYREKLNPLQPFHLFTFCVPTLVLRCVHLVLVKFYIEFLFSDSLPYSSYRFWRILPTF